MKTLMIVLILAVLLVIAGCTVNPNNPDLSNDSVWDQIIQFLYEIDPMSANAENAYNAVATAQADRDYHMGATEWAEQYRLLQTQVP